MNRHHEIATDWDAIYTKLLKERAEARYEYDILQGHGVGAYDRLQEQKLNKLHQFFVDFEKKYSSKKTPVRFIGLDKEEKQCKTYRFLTLITKR